MDSEKGGLVILEENHYYPFGLKHEKYNSDKYEYVEISKEDGGYFIGIEPLGPQQRRSYQYKYQGQERQDELGLNWDSFKWRNYDYAIGRFMSIDPLAEKYPYNSTYAFQENKMGMGGELEGLELLPNDVFNYLLREAAILKVKLETPQNNLKTGILNRVKAGVSGREKSNTNVAGLNVNKVTDFGTMAQSVQKIGNETKATAKKVTRTTADALEMAGDSMVISAPLTGPAAPVVAGVGSTLSTVGSTTNITLDIVEGDYTSAGKRIGNEIITGGLSTLAKNSPDVSEKASQIIDANIEIYDNIIIPIVQDNIDQK